MTSHLEHFLEAQEAPRDNVATHVIAREELKRGHKEEHWIWYIFPQILLGSSSLSAYYAIVSRAQAADYLRHPVLGPRLRDMTALVHAHLVEGVAPERLMGSLLDAQKLASSMTLFEQVAHESGEKGQAPAFSAVLDALAGHGIPRCSATLRWWESHR